MGKDARLVIEMLEKSKELFNHEIDGAINHVKNIRKDEHEFLRLMSIESTFFQFLLVIHKEFQQELLAHLKNGGTVDELMGMSHSRHLLKALDAYLSKSKAA